MKILAFLFFISLAGLVVLFGTPNVARAEASVKVTAPNGGQAYGLGQKVTITWTQADLDSVTVGFTKGGQFVTLLARDVNRSQTSGSYQWTVPSSTSDVGTDYKVKVKGWQDGNPAPFEDESDMEFSIIEPDYAPITVRSSGPGGKTIDRLTANVTIASFTIGNPSSNPKVKVEIGCDITTTPGVSGRGLTTRVRVGNTIIADRLESLFCDFNNAPVYIDSGKSITVSVDLSNSDAAPPNQFELYASISYVNAQTAGLSYIRAEGLPAKGATFKLASKDSTATRLTLNSPGANETWKAGERRTVRWKAENMPTQAKNQVTIGFIKTDGTPIGPTFKFTNNGSGQITVPTLAVATNNYRLRIFLECTNFVAACSAAGQSANIVKVIGSNPSATPVQPTPSVVSSALTDQANRIIRSGSDLNAFLSYRGIKRNSKDQEYAMKTFAKPLIGSERITIQQTYAINNFIVYGVPAAQRFNARQRYNVLVAFKRENRGVPKNATDWQKILSSL